MAEGKLKDVLRRMRTLGQVRALRGQGDGALLERFVADNDEAAFELLVQRHGPMVLGVCRRVLADTHDAEDAFQATFLLLARRASTVRSPGAVGGWLHAVACQVAGRARKARGQRNRLRVLTEFQTGRAPDSVVAGPEGSELRGVLDQELGRLPEKYRAPVVLCYLEDLSNTEAAEQLGWPVGTVKGRLARARALLQTRLTRRGVAPGAVLLAAAAGSRAALRAAVPPALGAATVRQALRVATGAAPAAAGTSPAVTALYRGGVRAMHLGQIKVVGVLLTLVSVCALSGAFAYKALAGHRPARLTAARRAPAPVRTDGAPAPREGGKKGGRTEPAGVPLAARLVGARESYKLDLGGKSAEEFRKQVTGPGAGPRRPVGRPGRRFPPSPAVGLKLEVTNTGAKELRIQFGGNANKLTLDLKGPGAFYAPVVVQNFMPIRRPPKTVVVGPGKTVTVADVPTLAFPKPGTGSQAYWTAPGDYTLTVDYVLGVSPAPAGTKAAADGFGPVVVRTAPITLKVVEAK